MKSTFRNRVCGILCCITGVLLAELLEWWVSLVLMVAGTATGASVCLEQPLLCPRRTAAVILEIWFFFQMRGGELLDSVLQLLTIRCRWRGVMNVFPWFLNERKWWLNSSHSKCCRARSAYVLCVSALWMMGLYKWLLNSVSSFKMTLPMAPHACLWQNTWTLLVGTKVRNWRGENLD